MGYERDEAMRQQEGVEAMIRMREPTPRLGYRPTTALRGRGLQIVERLRMLSRQTGIAHTAMAKLLQDDARDLEALLKEYIR